VRASSPPPPPVAPPTVSKHLRAISKYNNYSELLFNRTSFLHITDSSWAECLDEEPPGIPGAKCFNTDSMLFLSSNQQCQNSFLFANASVATSSSHLTALSSASWRSTNPWSEGTILRCGSSSAAHLIGTCLKRSDTTSADCLHTTLCSYGSGSAMTMCGGVIQKKVSNVKISLTSSLITIQNLVGVSHTHTLCAHVRGPEAVTGSNDEHQK